MEISKMVMVSSPVILILFFNLSLFNLPLDIYIVPNADNSPVIKVLIFNGEGSMDSSVEGIEKSLNGINRQNIIPYYFDYSTTEIINSKTLSGYDILIMPGGDASTYLKSSVIDSVAIKQFVQEGKGYIGICAGSYVASNSVDGYYSAWGIAPEVNTKNVDYEGSLSISFTSFGTKALSESLINIHMENGPAMYSNSSEGIMANYADNNTGYQDYAAIIGNSYGSGRVLLSGPHPELESQNSLLLAQMVLWTSKKI